MFQYLKPTNAPDRGSDEWGAGHFGAPRGSRKHTGHDVLVPPGAIVLSPVSGRIRRFGFPYADDSRFRLIVIDAEDGHRWRLFYVRPLAGTKPGEEIEAGEIVGIAQDLSAKFGRSAERGPMPNHVHLEVMTPTGRKVDPAPFLEKIAQERNE